MSTTRAGRPIQLSLQPVRGASPGSYPYRWVIAVGEAVISAAAAAGSALLVAGAFTPDVGVLAPLHLHSWQLPGVWLFASVALPSGVASYAAMRRSPIAPVAAVAASALLLVELAVQLPFLGPHPLQAVMGIPGVALGALAVRARRGGWR